MPTAIGSTRHANWLAFTTSCVVMAHVAAAHAQPNDPSRQAVVQALRSMEDTLHRWDQQAIDALATELLAVAGLPLTASQQQQMAYLGQHPGLRPVVTGTHPIIAELYRQRALDAMRQFVNHHASPEIWSEGQQAYQSQVGGLIDEFAMLLGACGLRIDADEIDAAFAQTRSRVVAQSNNLFVAVGKSRVEDEQIEAARQRFARELQELENAIENASVSPGMVIAAALRKSLAPVVIASENRRIPAAAALDEAERLWRSDAHFAEVNRWQARLESELSRMRQTEVHITGHAVEAAEAAMDEMERGPLDDRLRGISIPEALEGVSASAPLAPRNTPPATPRQVRPAFGVADTNTTPIHAAALALLAGGAALLVGTLIALSKRLRGSAAHHVPAPSTTQGDRK